MMCRIGRCRRQGKGMLWEGEKPAMPKATSYDTDFFLWTQQQVAFLQQSRWEQLDIVHLVEDTPSLQRFLRESEWFQKYYQRARRDAAREMYKPLTIFPATCPFTLEQLLDHDFAP